MPRSNNTYLGKQQDSLYPTPVATLTHENDPRIPESKRIKVYQFVGRETKLYVPQQYIGQYGIEWSYFHEQTGCDGYWDSWATLVKENAIRKIGGVRNAR